MLKMLFQKKMLWRFCAFLNTGSSKTPHTKTGGSPCQKNVAEKVEETKSPVVFPFDFFSFAFLAVYLHEELKNTTKMFSEIKPVNLKKISKKVPWHPPRFFFYFFFLSVP
jgi:hypothetical protein